MNGLGVFHESQTATAPKVLVRVLHVNLDRVAVDTRVRLRSNTMDTVTLETALLLRPSPCLSRIPVPFTSLFYRSILRRPNGHLSPLRQAYLHNCWTYPDRIRSP